MRDIARAAGVSQSTVSRVLSGAASSVAIGAETRARVVAEARSLGYRPNPLARGLRGASTMLIGAIVREIMDPFFAVAIEAISAVATSRGYNVVLGHAHGRANEAIALRAVLETRHCDAILVLGDMRDQPRLIDDLRASAVPTVALWQGSSLPGIATVSVDNAGGIRQALDLLTGAGHRDIAFIAAGPTGDIQARREAYLDYMRAGNLRVPDAYLPTHSNAPDWGAAAMESLMRMENPPSAVLAATDLLAMGALHGAYRAGVRVPDDVSVIGFDDIPLAAFTVPSLTTVQMPVTEMAAAAIRIAIDELGRGHDGTGLLDEVVAPRLVVRDSVGPPPRARSGSGRSSR